MRDRSRRLVQMVTGDKDTNSGSDEEKRSSDLDEKQERIADQMQHITNDIFVDDEIPGSDQEFAQTIIALPIRRISDSDSLFSGDFSDNDPSYYPVELKQQQPIENCSDDEDLITLQDLLGSKSTESIISFSGSPQPGPSSRSHPYVDLEEINKTALEVVDRTDNVASEIVQLIVTDILELVWNQVKTLSRWRAVDPNNWKKNVAKKRHAEGLSYTTNNQMRAPKIPKTINCANCSFKCTEKFLEQDRVQRRTDICDPGPTETKHISFFLVYCVLLNHIYFIFEING